MCYLRSCRQNLLPVFLAILSLSTETQAAVVIDEVLADPPSGDTGDANRDGARKTYEDEFIELYNTGPDIVSLAGWRLGDDDVTPAGLFTFPDSTTLQPDRRLVLFGGGSPGNFASQAFVDDGRIGNGLSNSGDVILLYNAAGDTVDIVAIAHWPKDQSIVRVPSGNSTFVAHKKAASDSRAFSPGQDIEDSTITDVPTPSTTSPSGTLQEIVPSADHEPLPPRKANYSIAISEILADPPANLSGDANGDGRRDTYEDEFVELHNTGSTPISLAGWRLTDDDSDIATSFRFPSDAVLAPDSYVVLFGGGTPSNFAVPVFVDDGRIGNGLTNSGDRLLLFDSAVDTVLDCSFTSESSLNQSLNRHEERYQPHNLLPGRGLFSPGQAPTEYTSFAIVDPKLNEGQTRDLMITGHYLTGRDTLDATKFQWLSVEPHVAQILSRARIKGLQPGQTRLEAWRDALFLAQKQIGVTTPEPPNDPPRITSKPDTAAFANGYYRYRVQATDPEQNTIVFTFAQAPTWLDFDDQSGLIEGHTPDTTGIFTVAFEAADGRGGHVAQSFRLHLQPRPQVRIDEVLSDPPPGMRGDANWDGYRHTYEDEFVELHNTGPAPVDLGGWHLSDGDGKAFSFPLHTVLPADGRAVVFGGGTATGPFTFSAGGRIGDGLSNRRDELYLIDPQGLDTLVHLSYNLSRDPNQSLVDQGKTLHSAWPGRAPFSPGAARPLLQSLRPNQHAIHLIRGEKRHLNLLGLYTDGSEYPIDNVATWIPDNTDIATITNGETLNAIATGSCLLSVRLEGYAITPDTVVVHIRQPLWAALRFAPTWHDSLFTNQPLPFIVRSSQPERHMYLWSVNSQRLPIMAPQYLHLPTGNLTDTIRVEIRRGFETSSRQWILHSPLANAKKLTALYATPLQAWPNPFNATTTLRFDLQTTGRARIALYNLQGQRIRTLVDEILNAGSQQIFWNGLDQYGHTIATGLYFARLTTPTSQHQSKILLLR